MHLLAKLARRPIDAAGVAVAAVVLAQLTIGSAAAAPMTGSSGLLAAVGGTGYLNSVAQDGPSNLWRLNETAGSTSVDSAGTDNLTVDSSATRGATGPLAGESSLATTFPALELAGEPESRGTFVLRGYHSVPAKGLA